MDETTETKADIMSIMINELNLKGTLHKKYGFESVSVLNLNSGDFGLLSGICLKA